MPLSAEETANHGGENGNNMLQRFLFFFLSITSQLHCTHFSIMVGKVRVENHPYYALLVLLII